MKLHDLGLAICCIFALLTIGTGLYGCTTTAGKTQAELMVFAAMSLKKPMTEIAHVYENRNTGVRVNLNCAGTSSLVAQVIAGAPVDVFASASRQDMDKLMQKGLVDVDTMRVFAINSVILVAPAGNKGELKSFEDLALDKVKRVAVGNPKLAPVGVYGEEVLGYFNIKDRIKDKLVYCDQVAQVCDYTARGEVDAGIIYLTDYLSRKEQLALIAEAPAGSHKPVEYPVAVIKQSKNKQDASQVIALLCSQKGGEILSANGFRSVNGVNK